MSLNITGRMNASAKSFSIESFNDYRDFLKLELEKRMMTNPGYSLRAFSRDISITPQNLSLVLKKKRSISIESATKIAEALCMNSKEASYFIDRVLYAKLSNSGAKKLAEFREKQDQTYPHYLEIKEDVFQAVAQWHYYALLELIQTDDFRESPAWIAKRLGINTFQVTEALERLSRLGMIKKVKRKWVRCQSAITTPSDIPSVALRSFARQILEKSIDALETQPLQKRDIGTITMAIDPKLLPEAKKMITQFRRKLCQFLETGKREEVYTFSTALISLTKTFEDKS